MKNFSKTERLILFMVNELGKNAYGFSLFKKIFDERGKEVSISTIHRVLHRLEAYSLLESKTENSSGNRGGKRKRTYSLTASGKKLITLLSDTEIL